MNNLLRNRTFLIIALLVLTTLAVYSQLVNHEFINYDDNVYITENPNVRSGLTAESVIWAFTTGYAMNWHPLTWISHMLDYQLYGSNPVGHHLTSLFFHILNSCLLFLVLKRMTGRLWESAFVAALFALHPLHVESVAWASERKDVLSTLFWILTVAAYVRYIERPGIGRYLLVFLLLALGLMAKPMLVTLPFVLLLLDYWPLNRFETKTPIEKGKSRVRKQFDSKTLKPVVLRLVLEKVPLFLLVIASSVVTYVAQKAAAMTFGTRFSIDLRLSNALLSYVSYVRKTIWPSDLALFYPHRALSENWEAAPIPLWQPAIAALVLLGITVIAIKIARNHPYQPVGWLWFLGTLVPVIGLVQVGEQGMADRYTYVPHIGLFIMIAWGASRLGARLHFGKNALAAGSVAVLSALFLVTWQQVGYWKNSITIFERTLQVNPKNPVAQYNLGYALHMQGKLNEAIAHYTEALRITPDYLNVHMMLIPALQTLGNRDKLAEAKSNYGTSLAHYGKLEEATAQLSEAVQLKPDFADARNNLGIVLALRGKMNEARDQFSQAIQYQPGNWNAHYNLGLILTEEGKLEQAIAEFSETLRLKPDHEGARMALQKARNR